jgi:hypothetical protein
MAGAQALNEILAMALIGGLYAVRAAMLWRAFGRSDNVKHS